MWSGQSEQQGKRVTEEIGTVQSPTLTVSSKPFTYDVITLSNAGQAENRFCKSYFSICSTSSPLHEQIFRDI